MTSRSDPRSVGKHDEEHLRRFLKARAEDDADEMRRWWSELVVDFKDRMDGFVAAAHRGRLDDEEHELAVQLAMIRFAQRLVRSFRGVSMGELVNATRTLARYACIDVQQQAVARREREVASLDALRGDPDADGAAPPHEVDAARRRHEADAAARDVRDFLAWALPQVSKGRRRVLELSFEGAELTEICTELDISDVNVYQRRSRGLKDLAKLKELYDA